MKTLYQGKQKDELNLIERARKERSYLIAKIIGLAIVGTVYFGEGLLNYKGADLNKRMAKAKGVPTMKLNRLEIDALGVYSLFRDPFKK